MGRVSFPLALMIGLIPFVSPVNSETLQQVTLDTAQRPTSLFVRGGQLFDGTEEGLRSNTGILIEDNLIKVVDAKKAIALPAGTHIIELLDHQTILPGMIDLHGHYGFDFLDQGRVGEIAYNGLVYLANGVTSTWTAGEFTPKRVIRQRDLIESGDAIGPRLLSSGPYFGGFRCEYNVKVAEDDCIAWPNDITDREIRDEVDLWADTGISSIKIKQATPHEMRIIIDQARKHNLTTTGHLANYNVEYDVSTSDAIKMGIDRVEHQLMLALSPEEADLDEMTEVINLMIKHQVFYGPNLQMYGSVNLRRANAEDMVWIDESKYFTPYARNLLQERGPLPPESDWPEYRQRVIELMTLYRAGGDNLLVVGTDEPVYTTLLPGFAYHRELFAMELAGLPANVVLKAATINGARALGLADKLGSIERNKFADLIIVDGNPLEDIKNVRNLVNVIKNGELYSPQVLLKSVEGKIGPRDATDHSKWILNIPALR